MTDTIDEARFREIFAHLGAVTAYAARRGSRDPDGVAAEVMTIAWRRLGVVPADDSAPVALRHRPQRRLRGGALQAAHGARTGIAGTSPAPEVDEPRPRARRGAARPPHLRPRGPAARRVGGPEPDPGRRGAWDQRDRVPGAPLPRPTPPARRSSQNRSPRLSPSSTWREHDHRNHTRAPPRREPCRDGFNRRRRRALRPDRLAAGRGSAPAAHDRAGGCSCSSRLRSSRRSRPQPRIALSHWVFARRRPRARSRGPSTSAPRRSSSCRRGTHGPRSSSGPTPSWCAAAGGAWPSRSTRARGSATGSARSERGDTAEAARAHGVLNDLMKNRISHLLPTGAPENWAPDRRAVPATSSMPTTAATSSSSASTPTPRQASWRSSRRAAGRTGRDLTIRQQVPVLREAREDGIDVVLGVVGVRPRRAGSSRARR